MKAKHTPARNSGTQLQRLAQERADEQARRIPWQRLYETQKQYIECQEFCFWYRSIVESEGLIPDWLSVIVDQHCPGFMETVSVPASRPVELRLEDWIDEQVFASARNEGWFDAIVYYAIREPQYQRAEVCWSECARQWAEVRPIRYPSFEEWKALAAACDESAHLVPEQREAQASARLVDRGLLDEAITRYIDWEALGYWARPALEHGAPIVDEVRAELERRCPGFLQQTRETQESSEETAWEDLMSWIADQFFANAKAEGWFDAILFGVRKHPRAIRTMEFADHQDEVRGSNLPTPYPSFCDWRQDADSYVETAPG